MTQTQKFAWTEVDNVRSYMVEMETREILHLDRADTPLAKDIARTLEKIATGIPNVVTALISNDYVMVKVAERWKVGIWRDGAVIVKVPDCVLVADDEFLLLCMDEFSLYAPIAKGKTITWDDTEEYFTPSDVRHLVKETIKRVFERAHWL